MPESTLGVNAFANIMQGLSQGTNKLYEYQQMQDFMKPKGVPLAAPAAAAAIPSPNLGGMVSSDYRA
jgi:hypothetical protein